MYVAHRGVGQRGDAFSRGKTLDEREGVRSDNGKPAFPAVPSPLRRNVMQLNHGMVRKLQTGARWMFSPDLDIFQVVDLNDSNVTPGRDVVSRAPCSCRLPQVGGLSL